MSDSISVTTHKSYGSRLWDSFKKIWIWFILLIVSIWLLARNENNYVDTKKAYEEWTKNVQEANIDSVNPDLEWQLIHISWKTTSNADTLIDPVFWVKTDDLKLYRYVEMYQRYEESHTQCTDNIWWSEDCTTKYDYYKKRSNNRINSNNFQESAWHQNPSEWIYESEEREKSPITIWSYTLSNSFTNQLISTKDLSLKWQELIINWFNDNRWNVIVNHTEVRNNWTWNDKSEFIICTDEEKNASMCNLNLYPVCGSDWNSYDNQCLACVTENVTSYTIGECASNTWNNNIQPAITTDSNSNIHVYDSYIYFWKNPSTPEIWDIKISFTSTPEWVISVIWKQNWSNLWKYIATNNKAFALLYEWTLSADEMFSNAQSENKLTTRILRFVWLLLMFIAFNMIFDFLITLAKVLPFLSRIIGAWAWIISFWLTTILWLITIWIAWLYARPIIGVIILILGLWLWYLILRQKKEKTTSTVTQPETNNSSIKHE